MSDVAAHRRVKVRIAAAVSALKRVAGMPDYAAYLAHLRAHHPRSALPTEREYYALYLQRRYEGIGSRCC